MTDRELLELAAKAAGIEPAWGLRLAPTGQVGACGETIYRRYQCIKVAGRNWDPLTDDGDALRLAVKLQMDLLIWEEYVAVSSIDCAELDEDALDGCIYAATRRAIVRAAASIGKDMQ